MNTQTPTAQADAQPPKKSNRKRSLLILLLVIVVAGAGWIAYELLYGRWHQSTDDAYVAGNIVSIVPQTMGTVVSIDADNGMRVQAGQPLVHLDPNDAQVSYDQAVANLAGTVRQVRGLYSSVESSESDLRARQVAVDQARADVKRREGLVATGAVSREELAHARDILASAEAALGGARGNLQRTRALVDATTVSKTPQVQAASSQLRQAYLNLQRTAILAPVSGYVAQRRVQLGQQVQPGTTLMTIVPIDQVWIEANFKETQLGKMRIGQPVEVHADLYGDDVTYQGKVDSLGLGTGSAFSLLPAQNASGNWIKIVQRLPVKIVLDPKQLQSHPLRIGLSTDVNVSLKDQNGPVLAPARQADAKPLMSTAAYEKQLADANQLITSIIEQNLPESAKTN
ncbi:MULTISPECIES: efflux RND transporter periplasmic adaptor subunit [Pseudoxanthomonas]|jgi:membrane fusion protein (multidrug efflux system)|uniref:HlyD family efflux transporter periplasmic adaptor subunit n=1 Tax=Pseudoxanthomonas winnipegensis TaxID=2480810 RepID=A0A4Q8LF81_9GAMM|nr:MULTISPECIES: efflux RND transporter periplasmic adaptor subunit [Pseudoxanthomonas]PZP58757.1 MAG: EmrA/EmrK family multidrug efflux transporter periplasmic adaptor subunit [Pseudoxanthomonas spadix]TAA28050.1 HlyD family efflux transporter periplasmic adaptor subunit [Pseudoxanthomonas winnipegensis]TMN24328.1 HlyD family efflux transporter periplasmic adaptor subunit [Pseudoxanthomonas sp. X-1]UAY73441.1 efflux RND transporter periplasmic adaptor subunit [Pseudoxanthomonas sp. X-1]